MITNTTVSINSNSTSLTDARIVWVRSMRICALIAAGIEACNCGRIFLMRSATLMTIAVRVMANLVTDDDADWVARAWRGGGRLSRLIDRRAPFT